MRQNTLVKFIQETKHAYNPTTGEYQSSNNITEFYCNVTQLSAKRSIELFGEYVDNTFIVRSTTPFLFNFQKVEINGKKYQVVKKLNALNRTSVVVKEVST